MCEYLYMNMYIGMCVYMYVECAYNTMLLFVTVEFLFPRVTCATFKLKLLRHEGCYGKWHLQADAISVEMKIEHLRTYIRENA